MISEAPVLLSKRELENLGPIPGCGRNVMTLRNINTKVELINKGSHYRIPVGSAGGDVNMKQGFFTMSREDVEKLITQSAHPSAFG